MQYRLMIYNNYHMAALFPHSNNCSITHAYSLFLKLRRQLKSWKYRTWSSDKCREMFYKILNPIIAGLRISVFAHRPLLVKFPRDQLTIPHTHNTRKWIPDTWSKHKHTAPVAQLDKKIGLNFFFFFLPLTCSITSEWFSGCLIQSVSVQNQPCGAR